MVMDVNGCSVVEQAIVQIVFFMLLFVLVVVVSCFGGSVFVMVSVIGGVLFYSYLWSNGVMIFIVIGLMFGGLIVFVMDVNSCVEIVFVNVF